MLTFTDEEMSKRKYELTALLARDHLTHEYAACETTGCECPSIDNAATILELLVLDEDNPDHPERAEISSAIHKWVLDSLFMQALKQTRERQAREEKQKEDA